MLASSLKELESVGLIERHQFNEIPVRVEYSLTSKCDLLFPAFAALEAWSIEMLQEEK
jgi:DNA-binding HxlR family transcriptional regulator